MQLTNSLIDKAATVCKSRAKLAQRLGVSRQLVSDWEKGKAMPTELHMAKMADIAGVRIEDALLARAEDMLSKTEEGQALLDKMRGGFLRGAAAGFAIFATLPAFELCQVMIDKINTLYIVSNMARTSVFKTLARVALRANPHLRRVPLLSSEAS